MITEGITINNSALIGDLVRGSILDTHSGSMRSMEAAKITRVELRKSVPDQPNHHRLMSRTTMNWITRLFTMKAANSAGYGQIGSGEGVVVYPKA